jgi:hypothetical protein
MTDRELDAWLAEHLFDAHAHEWAVDEPVGDEQRWRCSGCRVYFTGPNERPPAFIACAYSSTGNGMQLVLEAMRERGWYATIEAVDRDGRWYCRFNDDSQSYAYTDSLPRAVAEAAKGALVNA